MDRSPQCSTRDSEADFGWKSAKLSREVPAASCSACSGTAAAAAGRWAACCTAGFCFAVFAEEAEKQAALANSLAAADCSVMTDNAALAS